MAMTNKQSLGEWGEKLVAKLCQCPRCKRNKTFKLLPTNFKCADIICDFCGYLAQVKSSSAVDIDKLPEKVMGAAWSVQKERMNHGFYFSLYYVLKKSDREYAVYFLSSDLQDPDIFIARKPLSSKAKRAGWQGFYYDISKIKSKFVRIA